MRLRRLGSAALVVAAGLLGGCYDRAELEEQAFLISLGVDRSARGAVQAVAHVAVPSKLAAGMTGGGASAGDFREGSPIVSGSGRTLQEALTMMNSGIERSINLTHLSAVVFGERAARAGLLSELRPLVRYREFRRTLYLFVSRGGLSRVFTRDRPVLETSTTRLIEDLHMTSRRTGLAPSVQMHGFLSSLEMPNDDPVLPVLRFNERVGSEPPRSTGSLGHLALRANPAGAVNRAGGNAVECVGAAVFRRDRLAGFLDGPDARYLQLLNGSLRRVFVNVPDPFDRRRYSTLWMRYSEPLAVGVRLRPGPVRISVRQVMEAELLGDQGETSYLSPAARQALERAAQREVEFQERRLITKVFRQYGADPFHFFQYARSQFANYDAVRTYPWRERLPQASVEVSAHVSLRRLGTELNPPTNQ